MEGKDDQAEGEDEEEGESGERKVHKMTSPKKPSPAEVEEHNLTHLPFRNWCRHCVRGRGKEADHRVTKKEESGVPEIHLDYCFPGEEEAGKNLTVLAARTTGEFTGKRIMAFLRECGCEMSKLIVKSDQEPAILAQVEDR